MVDATDLKSVEACPRGGSSPPLGTKYQLVESVNPLRDSEQVG